MYERSHNLAPVEECIPIALEHDLYERYEEAVFSNPHVLPDNVITPQRLANETHMRIEEGLELFVEGFFGMRNFRSMSLISYDGQAKWLEGELRETEDEVVLKINPVLYELMTFIQLTLTDYDIRRDPDVASAKKQYDIPELSSTSELIHSVLEIHLASIN